MSGIGLRCFSETISWKRSSSHICFFLSTLGGAQYAYNCSGASSREREAAPAKSKGRIAAPPARVKTTVQRTGSSSDQRPMKSSSQTAAPSLPAPAEDNSALTQALQSVSHLQGEIERLQTVNDELQTEMNGIEKERDFYFDKLRDIEMMLQDVEDSGKGLTAPL
jgi:microtubule-associated protein, RP/EB family